MKHLTVNKFTIIDHTKLPEPFAVTEIRIDGEVVWTNKHGLREEL